MRQLTALDLCCCDGGATRGYQLAGFKVTGVDVNEQPRYCGDDFVRGDAIEFLERHGHQFDVVVGSPPCQHDSPLNAYNHKSYPQLIEPMREGMRRAGRPYVIENVETAGYRLIDPVMLCGPMFGLSIYRHRLFESSAPLTVPAHGPHLWLCTRNGYLPTPARPFMSIHGGKHSRAWALKAAEVMGVPWVVDADTKRSIRSVCEAIPPAYTEWIGRQLAGQVLAAA